MKRWILSLLPFLLLFPSLVSAQGTLLPYDSSYESYEQAWSQYSDEQIKELNAQGIFTPCDDYLMSTHGRLYFDSEYLRTLNQEARDGILACSIKNGRVKLWMLPYFITYFANFFIGLAGTISVLFVILGGFWYMTGGVTDDKEKGKKTIQYALVGLAITLLAWVFINVIQVQITG